MGQEKKIIKRPYQAPQLKEYGDLSKLTQGSVGMNADGGPTRMTKA